LARKCGVSPHYLEKTKFLNVRNSGKLIVKLKEILEIVRINRGDKCARSFGISIKGIGK